TQFYGGAANAGSGVLIGGWQDNGTLRRDTSGTWTRMFGGDGGWCAADSSNSNYFYGEYVYCMVHRSINAGMSSNYIYNNSANPLTDAGVSTTSNFIAAFI